MPPLENCNLPLNRVASSDPEEGRMAGACLCWGGPQTGLTEQLPTLEKVIVDILFFSTHQVFS